MREFGEPGTGTHPVWVDAQAFHLDLARFNTRRTLPGRPGPAWLGELERDLRAHVRELEFLEGERAPFVDWASEAPPDPKRFAAWLADLSRAGPGAGDPLLPFLAARAGPAELRQVLRAELQAEGPLPDLLALANVGLAEGPRRALARLLAEELEPLRAAQRSELLTLLASGEQPGWQAWEGLARANLLRGLAANRAYGHHALGALAARLLTQPDWSAQLALGVARLGLPGPARAHLERRASEAGRFDQLSAEVLAPLLAADPTLAQPLAEGALVLLQAQARCLERYRADLGMSASPVVPTVH